MSRSNPIAIINTASGGEKSKLLPNNLIQKTYTSEGTKTGASHVLFSSTDHHPRLFPALSRPPILAYADTHSNNCFCANCPSSQLPRHPPLAHFHAAEFATKPTSARVPPAHFPSSLRRSVAASLPSPSAQHPRAKRSHQKRNEPNSKPLWRNQKPVFALNPPHFF